MYFYCSVAINDNPADLIISFGCISTSSNPKQTIYIVSIVKLKSHPSVTPTTRLSQPTSTYQLPNIIKPLSSYFKFVTAS